MVVAPEGRCGCFERLDGYTVEVCLIDGSTISWDVAHRRWFGLRAL
jgi:hypothetical protein